MYIDSSFGPGTIFCYIQAKTTSLAKGRQHFLFIITLFRERLMIYASIISTKYLHCHHQQYFQHVSEKIMMIGWDTIQHVRL
jgi:hypothetical protein